MKVFTVVCSCCGQVIQIQEAELRAKLLEPGPSPAPSPSCQSTGFSGEGSGTQTKDRPLAEVSIAYWTLPSGLTDMDEDDVIHVIHRTKG
jgi:hypothetical protein